MSIYKKLDKLCKDCYSSDTGISTYISLMEECHNERYKCDDWIDVYKTLKHYRYIRNCIAHNEDDTEDDLCSDFDVEWLELFYDDILNGNDPLTLYRKEEDKLVNKKIQNVKNNSEEIYRVEKSGFWNKLINKIKSILFKT